MEPKDDLETLTRYLRACSADFRDAKVKERVAFEAYQKATREKVEMQSYLDKARDALCAHIEASVA